MTTDQYKGWDPEAAVADYFKRIQVQANKYEEVTDDEGPFIKIINVGERIIIHRIEGEPGYRLGDGGLGDSCDIASGYLQTRCCFFLMNIHNQPRTIYFARVSPADLCCSQIETIDISLREPAVWSIPHRTFLQGRL